MGRRVHVFFVITMVYTKGFVGHWSRVLLKKCLVLPLNNFGLKVETQLNTNINQKKGSKSEQEIKLREMELIVICSEITVGQAPPNNLE